MTPTCVWKLSNELVLQLDSRFGEPTDGYVNGSQVWLRELQIGSKSVSIEWRLHPIVGYAKPADIDHQTLFADVACDLRAAGDEDADVSTLPAKLWDGLEAFPAFGDEVDPHELASAASIDLGIGPDQFGLVDHSTIGDAWEHTQGGISIVAELVAQLQSPPR